MLIFSVDLGYLTLYIARCAHARPFYRSEVEVSKELLHELPDAVQEVVIPRLAVQWSGCCIPPHANTPLIPLVFTDRSEARQWVDDWIRK